MINFVNLSGAVRTSLLSRMSGSCVATDFAAAASYGKIVPYTPPAWAQNLKIQPKQRFKLSMTPTPIHRWRNLPGVPESFEVYIKREDLIGSTLSGNKIRKLEFLLADAMEQGCDGVVTFGGFSSNHSRATAIAAREVGLEPHILVLSPTPQVEMSCKGNLLLSRLVGTKMVVFPAKTNIDRSQQVAEVKGKMKDYVEKLSQEGHKTYMIPPGGSSTLGAWGYIDGFNEMMQQGVLENFDDIFVATGSVGTVCGLAIGKHLTSSSIRLHAIATHITEEFIYSHIDEQLEALGVTGTCARDLVYATSDYVELGYGRSTTEELETVVEVMSQTGLSIDPEFNVKSVKGMLQEMQKHPERLKGKRILYIHSGGVFGLFDGRVDEVVQQRDVTNKICLAHEVFK